MKPNPEHAKRYAEWHWGIPPVEIRDWPDRDFPRHMVEIGRLVSIRFTSISGQTQEIHIENHRQDRSHVAFDPKHPKQRIYILLAEEERRGAVRRFWHPKGQTWMLEDAARFAPGVQCDRTYPKVRVQPIGFATHVTYLTNKKGDGLSQYIHHMGEDGGVPPVLALDRTGRLWFAGGSYTCPTAGITR